MDVSSSPTAIGRRRSRAVTLPADSRVPSQDGHKHNINNDVMMMTTMMTIGSSSLSPYKIQAAGSWRVGGIMVSVFLYFWLCWLYVYSHQFIAGRYLVTCEW